MNIDLINDFTRYNLWANKRLSKTILENDRRFWYQHNRSSFGSLGQTIQHIAWAEYLWSKRIEGKSTINLEKPGNNEGIEITINQFIDISSKLVKLVVIYDAEDLLKMLSYHTFTQGSSSSRRNDMILHCVNHSTYHRGQVVNMMRDCGVEDFTPLDYIYYKRHADEEVG